MFTGRQAHRIASKWRSRRVRCCGNRGGQGRNRTTDTRIFRTPGRRHTYARRPRIRGLGDRGRASRLPRAGVDAGGSETFWKQAKGTEPRLRLELSHGPMLLRRSRVNRESGRQRHRLEKKLGALAVRPSHVRLNQLAPIAHKVAATLSVRLDRVSLSHLHFLSYVPDRPATRPLLGARLRKSTLCRCWRLTHSLRESPASGETRGLGHPNRLNEFRSSAGNTPAAGGSNERCRSRGTNRGR
jgi:hypothetical protein